MSVGNRLVASVLRSPVHRLLSASTLLVRYTGRRSGATIATPAQYAWCGRSIVIAVAQPEAKTW